MKRGRWAHWHQGAGGVAASWHQERPACWQSGRHTVAVGGGGEGGRNPQSVNIRIQQNIQFYIPSFPLPRIPTTSSPTPTPRPKSFTSFPSFHVAGSEPPSKVLTVFQRLSPERDSSLKTIQRWHSVKILGASIFPSSQR